jgi:hypothetical protein
MNYFKFLSVIFILIAFNACCSQKNTKSIQKEEVAKVSNQVQKKMTEQGYHKAVVIYNAQKSAPCNYLLKIDDLIIEPRQELKTDFKKDQQIVWVKYHPQRRMSRCENAQPVEIVDIKIYN